MLKLFDLLEFLPFLGLLSEPYHDSGPGRPYYNPVSVVKAFMLQRFMCIPSERALADELARSRDYRRICGFRRYTPSRGCLTYFRRKRMGEHCFKRAFEFMVMQAIALGAVKGYVVAIDSTAFKAYSARDATNKRGISDPDADVGRAGGTYILGYRAHLACVEGDVPLAFTVQAISRNDKLFYKKLLEDSWKTGVKFRVEPEIGNMTRQSFANGQRKPSKLKQPYPPYMGKTTRRHVALGLTQSLGLQVQSAWLRPIMEGFVPNAYSRSWNASSA